MEMTECLRRMMLVELVSGLKRKEEGLGTSEMESVPKVFTWHKSQLKLEAG